MPDREIIFEFRTIAASTQVRAIDVETAIEVAVTVPTSANKNQMMHAAKNKLIYVLKQKMII